MCSAISFQDGDNTYFHKSLASGIIFFNIGLQLHTILTLLLYFKLQTYKSTTYGRCKNHYIYIFLKT